MKYETEFFFRWITSSSISIILHTQPHSIIVIIIGRLATQTSRGSCTQRTSLPLLAVCPGLHIFEGMQGENECNRPFDGAMNSNKQ